MSESETVTLWAQYRPRYAELAARPLSTENVSAWLHDWSELEKELQELGTLLQRNRNEDTRDKTAEAAFTGFVREVVPHVEVANQKLKVKLLELGGYTPDAEHAEFVKRFRNEAELFREENAPLLAEEVAFSSEYNAVVGKLTVQLDGETLTLPEAGKKLLEPDRDLRERAWRAINKAKLSVNGDLDELFLKLLGLRRRLARNADVSDFRAFAWRRLNRFDYAPEESLGVHDAIKHEVVPLVGELREEQRTELSLDVLRPWDLAVDPHSRPPLKPFTTVEELEDGAAHIFRRLDPELGEQFSSLRDGWLDLENREGKVPGLGYQDFFPKSRRPYIYQNATGTHGDVTTLLHEAGHAFHSVASAARNDLVWNFYPGMEFAEVASQAMELLALPYLDRNEGGFYSPEDATRARRDGLESVLLIFPYVAKGDAFQHWLYTEAPEDVNIKEIDAKWLELDERFSPGVDWSGLEHVRAKGWQYFHIFVVPFYMLEYAFAWLGAVQIWQNALSDPQTALEKYREALALGGTRPLPELFEVAGARFAFDRETVGTLMRFVYEQR